MARDNYFDCARFVANGKILVLEVHAISPEDRLMDSQVDDAYTDHAYLVRIMP